MNVTYYAIAKGPAFDADMNETGRFNLYLFTGVKSVVGDMVAHAKDGGCDIVANGVYIAGNEELGARLHNQLIAHVKEAEKGQLEDLSKLDSILGGARIDVSRA
jgi:hypothetical protein